MTIIIPDRSWYKQQSLDKGVSSKCPYANIHKCPRYYESMYMLGKVRMITKIEKTKIKELDNFWEKSNIIPVIEEEMTYIEDGRSGFGNFCPELAFEYLNYYSDDLHKYADEIDKEYGAKIAESSGISNDWRLVWATVRPKHYLDCDVFDKVKIFNSRKYGKFDGLVHDNIIKLIQRMEVCLDEGDYSGVLHASANIYETMAKDIINSQKIENQTLGSFIEKFNKESKLPDSMKGVVKEVYDLRNTTPMSGHGSTKSPEISFNDALVISAMTKALIEIEYKSRA